jgi:hypothetical protein
LEPDVACDPPKNQMKSAPFSNIATESLSFQDTLETSKVSKRRSKKVISSQVTTDREKSDIVLLDENKNAAAKYACRPEPNESKNEQAFKKFLHVNCCM